jgi:hypothetical protein
MKKLFGLILLLFIITTARAEDFQPAKLQFADGKEKTGLIKVSSIQEVNLVYKASEKADKEKIKLDELSRIIIPQKEGEAAEYVPEYFINPMNGKKSKDPVWVQVLLKGPATLYAQGGGMMTTRGGQAHQVTDVTFYIKRTGEEGGTWVGAYFTSGAMGINIDKTFRKHAGKYFADYPELATRIENKEFKILEVPAVVEEYNKWKTSKASKK